MITNKLLDHNKRRGIPAICQMRKIKQHRNQTHQREQDFIN